VTFLLDENIPKKLIDILIELKYQYIDIRGTEKEGITDSELINLAKAGNAVLITTDKDFFHTYHFINKPHPGIIVIALRQPDSDSITRRFNWFLRNYDMDEIENRCFMLLDNKIIIYE
jgi:predicted nuclease of predicted toxin-antitoxin system